MNPVAIIQARMGSTRLPGKVLKEVCGKPLLWHMLYRLKYSKTLKNIIVATSTLPQDDVIEKNVIKWGFECFRGSPNDLLDRYYKTAVKYNADPVVRLTADCPLIDPKIVDTIITEYLKGDYDVVGTNDNSFPDGLDVTAFSFRSIKTAWEKAELPSEREHVGPYILKQPEVYKNKSMAFKGNYAHMRWTVDEDRDFKFVNEIFERLYKEGEMFYSDDILALLEKEPQLLTINSNIIRNEGYLKSLKEDKKYLEKTK